MTPSMNRTSIEQFQLIRLQLETSHMTEGEAKGALTLLPFVSALSL